MVGRHLVDSQKIAVRYIGRESADSRSIYRSRFLSVCMVFSPLSIALEKKLEQDYWNINRLPPLTHGDSWKIRIFGHFSVSYESKLLKIKHESMPLFAINSIPFCDIFWYGHAQTSNPIFLDFSAFFSLFLFLLFLSFCCRCLLPVASPFKNFRESIIQKGNSYQVMKREIFPSFFSLNL